MPPDEALRRALLDLADAERAFARAYDELRGTLRPREEGMLWHELQRWDARIETARAAARDRGSG